MARRDEQCDTVTIDDLYKSAHGNKDFEIIEQGIINHLEWLTQIPDKRRWGIIHQIVYHGNVDQLNRLLVLQTRNKSFRLLSRTNDNKTVLEIARERKEKNGAMHQRIERLVMMDKLLDDARARNWDACQFTINQMPDIVNEKPPYRKFYFIHHVVYAGDQKRFDDYVKQYKLDLNLLTNNDKSIVDIANEKNYKDFSRYLKSLKEQNQSRGISDEFSHESRESERAHAREFIMTAKSCEPYATSVQDDDTLTTDGLAQLSLTDCLTCPLSGKLLKVPVVASDGYTYEKENILQYFKTHDHSAITNEVFKNKELQTNHTIEKILKTMALRPATMSTYYKVQKGDTLAKIAEQKNFTLDQMKAANPELRDYDRLVPNQVIKLPLIQQLIESTSEKAAPVSDKSVTVFQHFVETNSQPLLVPECASNQKLSDAKERLKAVFIANDVNKDGFMPLEEFETFLSNLNVRMYRKEINGLFKEIKRKDKDKITFQEFYQYYEDMIKGEKSNHTRSEIDLLTAFLKADSEGKCELGGISQFINKCWEKFNNFKRDGKTGKLVMTGGDEAQDVLPGEYSLVDLIAWSDIAPKGMIPQLIKVQNVRWIKSVDPKSESGRLVFPRDFVDTRLPVDIGTNDKLAYYGCCLANESQMKVSLLHRHAIQDFTYYENYYNDFVKGRAGLERHEFAHLDCPFEENSGFFILGKFSEQNENELHLTAFKIPVKHTLYVPPLTIHSNDYLRGTWRTMLSDATDIDHVILERLRCDNGKDQISFDFLK